MNDAPKTPASRLRIMSAPRMTLPYRALRALLRGVILLLARFDIAGVENIPLTGPLIVAPNHIHLFDTVVVFAAIPREMTVFAGEKWQRTPFGWLMSAVANAIYVQRGQVDRQALGSAIAALRAGHALGLAPEGTRSRSGGLLPGKDGVAYLASRTGAVILPVAAWGQEQVGCCLRHLQRPVIHIRIGQPIRLPPEAARVRAADLGAYTDEVMLALARMLPPEYRGVYAERV